MRYSSQGITAVKSLGNALLHLKKDHNTNQKMGNNSDVILYDTRVCLVVYKLQRSLVHHKHFLTYIIKIDPD